MITVRRGSERRHRHGKREVWLTFFPQDRAGPLADGFGTLEFLDENSLPPGASIPRRPPPDADTITYVHDGSLAYEDAMGRSGVIQAGEFRRTTAGGDIGCSETNASRSDWAHVFRIGLRASKTGREPGHEQKRFSVAERRNRLCLVASPDARNGSLRVHENALMYSAMLDPGHHVTHELFQGRSAWLHVVRGEVALGDIVLTAGDGAGIEAERAISFTAREEASILLLDVGERLPGLPETRGADPGNLLVLGGATRRGRGSPARMPGSRQSSGEAAAELSGAALFKLLWDALVDVIGTAATAAIVSRALREALPRNPDLAELVIARADREYGYVVPRSFDRAAARPVSVRDLLGELRPLLTELTGHVVLRRLEAVPELRAWATTSP